MTSNGHQSGKPLRAGDPRELDGYRIVSRLGRGGMGTVYLAKDAADRTVAVKLIHPDLADDEAFRRRFAREVESARRVARFSTAGVIDARLDGDPLFIVSEYVPGPNLDEAVRADGAMAGGTLESLAMGVAAALTAIHGSGVIHRDLKPANVLLSPVGPKVIDFGIARALDGTGGAVTRSSQLMGTPSYMAPELIMGRQPTPAGDIFAWGCLVAFAGTGSAPFDAATVPAVLHNISSAPPRLDGLDPSLYDLVSSALDKEPENRPSSQQILARLVGQEDPVEAEVRRTITTSWAPPSSTPVPGAPPETATRGREPEASEAAESQGAEPPVADAGAVEPGAAESRDGVSPVAGPRAAEPRAERSLSEQPAPPVVSGSGGQDTRSQQPHERPTRIEPVQERSAAADPALAPASPVHPVQQHAQGRPPSGPEQLRGQGGHPPQGPGGQYGGPAQQGQPAQQSQHAQPGYQGQPGYYGPSGGHPAPPVAQPMHGAQSPPYGQTGFSSHAGPVGPGGPGGGPGGPGQPNGPGGDGPRSGSGGARRRLVVVGGAVGALVLVAAAGTVFWVSQDTPVPENTVSIYNTDFTTDPGWTTNEFEVGESDGYWAEQSGVVLTLDPEDGPSRGEVVPLERDEPLPDQVLVSATAYVVEGPEQATVGVRCWDNDGEEYRSQYEALLRYDGERAEIRRMHEGEGDLTLSQTTEVPAYEPYPLFDESARDQVGDGASGGPYDFDVESVSTNTVSLSCALQESDEGDTVMELSMWVNGEHALTTVDTDPLPDDAEETEDRRRVGIVSRPGPGNEPLGVLYTAFSVHEIVAEE
ncbi:serine/threonine-protein kinase [Nocardiopsis aegyptia]|uniref:Serine/threonine protein kinase n=1 Tax=Nocardiopsis aegyptia TaxID=220378 RepID=A0A7Z0JC18_9ACTN|nr:serine/threonine-protein kinase [Nocardiopsis aegyptia]NYJ36796.1 serine/threonine protein kinase [Nocardiopsis aegyptia]